MKKSEYINLKINGRLFPSWVMANFKDYKLPELIKGNDPCNETYKDELRKYQTFVSRYLDNTSPYKDLLIYHGLGAGKTATLINLYNVLYNATPGWNIFLLIRASLHNEPWLAELKKWLSEKNYDDRMQNIHFVHYDSPYADKNFLEEIKKSDTSKKNIFVIEEAHNFIKNVYSNISSKEGKKAQIIYDYIIKEKLDKPNTRIVCISATPAINTPYELALLFNLLRPGIFPNSEAQFNSIFVHGGTFPTINESTKNTFQRRIMGLVSFYIGATPDAFATQMRHNVDVMMSDHQAKAYEYFEEIEAAQMKKSLGKSESYRTYTRQACNFVFPHIDQHVNAEARPRPGKFRISEREAAQYEEGEIALDKKSQLAKYVEALDNYIKTLRRYFDNAEKKDKDNKHTIHDDVKIFKDKYKGDYEEFSKEKHSNLLNLLKECSHKMVRIILNISISKGPVLVYSNYVVMEGLQIFKLYLNYFGYSHISNDNKPGYSYAEFHGSIDQKERAKTVSIFKDPKNMYGDLAKIILISPAGSEGISLYNMRQVHIMEPYWHETRITQMIGRAVRLCSHKALPKEERHVDVFRYKSVRKNTKQTSDQYIEDLARSKDNLIQSFLDPIKEVAVDCALFQPHNKLLGNYKCFQFNQNSLFDNNIGPAYRQDIKDDLKLDNGLNSINSTVMKVRVVKIKAVKLLNSDIKSPKYSDPDNYWYSSDTRVVYDYDLHYPIGKVAVEEDIPVKIEGDIYVMDKVIPIPMITK